VSATSEQLAVEPLFVAFVIEHVMAVATSLWKTVKAVVSGMMGLIESFVIEFTVRLLTVQVAGAALKANWETACDEAPMGFINTVPWAALR
jgi:hypothetical protein